MKTIFIIDAKHKGNHKLEIVFNDNKKTTVNFESFLKTHRHPQFNKYKKVENFKKFKIENGNIIWGRNWDMIFPLHELYEGKIS
jgi:hypothetical protein